MRRRSQRFQNEAPRAFSRAGRSGVPARTSRNGNRRPTCWLAFSSRRPLSRSSVCASSSSRTSGRFDTRFRSTVSKDDRPRSFARPVAGRSGEICSGNNCRHQARDRIASANPPRSSAVAGLRPTTSSASRSPTRFSSQKRRAVFPLPRGPQSAISAGGATPRSRSSSRRRKRACSSSRPAKWGGNPPSPGWNGPEAPATPRPFGGMGSV